MKKNLKEGKGNKLGVEVEIQEEEVHFILQYNHMKAKKMQKNAKNNLLIREVDLEVEDQALEADLEDKEEAHKYL